MALCEQKVCVVENTPGHNQLVSFLDHIPDPELSRNEIRVELGSFTSLLVPPSPRVCPRVARHSPISASPRLKECKT